MTRTKTPVAANSGSGVISAAKVKMRFNLICNNPNCQSGFRIQEGTEVFNRCPYCGQSVGFTCKETGEQVANTSKENRVYLTVGA